MEQFLFSVCASAWISINLFNTVDVLIWLCIRHILLLYMLWQMSVVCTTHSFFNPAPICQIRNLSLLHFCLSWFPYQMAGRVSRRQLELMCRALARAKGKMTFPCCLFLDASRKNARAAVLFLLSDSSFMNSSLPLECHSVYTRTGLDVRKQRTV